MPEFVFAESRTEMILENVFGTNQHNDNSGNKYSDVFWVASVIKSIGVLEFGAQVYHCR